MKALGMALVGATLVLTASPVEAAPNHQSITWTDAGHCDPVNDKVTCETAELRLPVDHARPWAETFELHVARRKATGARIGVLMVNPGGPGDPGSRLAFQAVRNYSPEVLERFDIIAFDPRGVGASRGIRCSADLLARMPMTSPANQSELDQLIAYNRELREDCRKHSGPVVDHADTVSVARDMDALRRALGERTISYFGHSYGSLIGQQYAELFPRRVRAMTISANMDHSLGIREFVASSAATAEDSFTSFTQWCARTESCALHGQDVAAVWERVLAKADRGVPDPDRPGATLRTPELIWRTIGKFKGPDWPGQARLLATIDAQPAPPAHGFAAGAATESGQTREFSFAATFCEDWRFRVTEYREFARLAEIQRAAAPRMRGLPPGRDPVALCAGWPSAPNNPQHVLRLDGAPRILMINARHDPVSAYSWAVNVHRQTRGTTVLLTYDGWGHAVYQRNDCTRSAVDRYLIDQKLPVADTHCPANPV
ncbi:alpha/beta hydrolase [Streptoalloteichus hindustanus]|uniref:Alpha/beta hydrolase fold n=1 Tax=Streptoalloteichus hindustanus TaxID=2017 RepID=A0A1M5IET2_STRHI|nr:alpha/beta hydrolase [Streptoalloteichus hindustanus]SHG26775.1 alpha/beta hydrolase fold [Streptoalloteichus hindustanus]